MWGGREGKRERRGGVRRGREGRKERERRALVSQTAKIIIPYTSLQGH